MALDNIMAGAVGNEAPLIGLKGIDPLTNLEQGDTKNIPLIGLRGDQNIIQVKEGQTPAAYNRILDGNYHPEFLPSTTEEQLAQNQTRAGYLLNTLGQVAVGELAGGFLKDFGYLLGGPAELSKNAEDSLGKSFIEAGQKAEEWAAETFPTYRSPSAPKFDPTSWSWWLQNAKGFSSILPAAALAATGVGIAGAVGEGLGIASALGVGVEEAATLGTLAHATAQQHIFSMMFAKGTYDQLYQESKGKGMSEEDANKKAAIGASATYSKNWAAIVLNLGMAKLFRGSHFIPEQVPTSPALGAALRQEVAPLVLSEAQRKLAGAGLGSAMMGWQYIANEEGKFAAEKAFDPSLKGDFSNRVGDYLSNGDFWSGVFIGGIGMGLATEGLSRIAQRFQGDPQVNQVKSWAVDDAKVYDKMKTAESLQDDVMKEEAREELLTNMGTRGKATGMLDQTIDFFKKIASGEFSPEEAEKLGIDPNRVSRLKGVDIDKAVEKIRKAGDAYESTLKETLTEGTELNKAAKKLWGDRTDDLKGIPFPAYASNYAAFIAKTETKLTDLNEHRIRLDKEVSDAERGIINFSALTENKQQQVLNQAHVNTYENQKTQLEDVSKSVTNNDIEDQRAKALEKVTSKSKINAINKRFDELAAERKVIDDHAAQDIKISIAKLNDRINSHTATLNRYKKSYSPEEKEVDDAVNFDPVALDNYYKKLGVYMRVESNIDSYQNALKRYKAGDISSPEARAEFNKNFQEENQDIKESLPEQNDYVRWMDYTTGIEHQGRVESVDETDPNNYTVQEIDENWQDVGEPTTKNKGDLTLLAKIGDLDVDKLNVEPLGEKDLTPDQVYREYLENSGTNRSLSDLANSLSYSHIDPITGRVTVRDVELDGYASHPDHTFEGGRASYTIDWDNDFWEKGDKARRKLRDKAKAGELTDKDIEKLLSVDPANEGNFGIEAVDKIPIKIAIDVAGQKFSRGLYVHDSDFWNVREEEAAQKRIEARTIRRQILTALLKGQDVSNSGLSKLNGFFNVVPTNGNVHERLGVESGTFTVYVGVSGLLGDVLLQASPTDISHAYKPSQGGIYIMTNKTSNKERVLLKLNPQKLSTEHAEILFDAINVAYGSQLGKAGAKGNKAMLNRDDVTQLNVRQIINMLALFGDRATNPGHANNKNMPEYLKDKALYVRHEEGKTLLYFGRTGKIDLFEKNIGIADNNRLAFIEWATKNKNYRVVLEEKSMGYNLNEPFKTKKITDFRIGSFVNDPTKPYSAVMMDHNLLMTNIDRVTDPTDPTKKIESITHAPVIDINTRSLDIKTKPIVPEEPVIKPTVKKVVSGIKNIEQELSYDCGVNALKSVLSKFGIDENEKSLIKQTGAEEKFGTKLSKIAEVAQSKGLNAEVKKGMSFDDLKASVDKDIPVIILQNGVDESIPGKDYSGNKDGHYIIIKGYDRTGFIFEDPSNRKGDLHITEKELADRWHGLGDDEKTTVEHPGIIISGEAKPEAVINPRIKRLKDIKPVGKETYQPKPGAKLIGPEELQWLKEKLGPQRVNMTNKLIEIAGKTGKLHFGSFTADAINMFNMAPGEVLYHESFHRVSLGYLSDAERAAVYTEARRRYALESSTNAQIEEVLADKFMEYKSLMASGIEPPRRGFIDYIRDLYDFVKSIFTGESRLRSYDIDKLFESIERGKFKHVKLSAENLRELENKQIGYEISNVDIPTINNIKEMDSLVKGLATVLIKENHINNLNEVGNLKFEPLKQYIDHEPVPGKTDVDGNPDEGGLLQQFKSVEASLQQELTQKGLTETQKNELTTELKQAQHLVDLYNSILDPKYFPIFVNKINSALRSLNISKRETDVEEFEDRDISDNNKIEDWVKQLDKAGYEVDIKDTVQASVKFLIATLPESDKLNSMTFTADHVSFNDTWSNLLFDLHNTDTIDEALAVLDLKSDIYSYKVLAQRLRAGDDLLRIQFKSAMDKQKLLYINFLFAEGKDLYETVNGVKQLVKKGGITFEMSRADIFNAANVERVSWNEVLYNSALVDKEGIPRLDPTKVRALLKEYNDFTTDFSVDYEKSSKTLTDEQFDKYLNNLLPLLNKIGIDVDRPILDEVVRKVAVENKVSKAEALNRFLLRDLSHVYARLKVEADEKRVAIRNIYADEKVVRQLAQTKYEVKPDLMNDTVLGPGRNQYFSYSQNTYMSDAIRNLNKDPNAVVTKLSKTWNHRSAFLTQMMDENVRKNFKMLTFSAFLQKEIGDSGRDYLSINRLEDYLFKMYALERELVPFPTMGDKRMGQLLEGAKLIDFDLTWDDQGKPVIPQNVIDLFYDYALTEEERIKEVKATIDDYKSEKDPVVKLEKEKKLWNNYHYIKQGDNPINTNKANGLRHLLFPSFDVEGFDFNRDAKTIIAQVLSNVLDNELRFAAERGVITGREIEGRFIPDSNVKIDTGLIEKGVADHGSQQRAIENTIARFVMRHMQGHIEFTKLFSGDPAFKVFNEAKGNFDDDYTKRLSGAQSTGDVAKNESAEYGIQGENYRVATMYTQKANLERLYVKNLYENILEGQLKEIVDEFSKLPGGEKLIGASQKVQLGILKDKFNYNLVEMLSPYKNIDFTDGQGWISPAMYRALSIKMNGEWSPEKEEAFNLLQSEKELTPEQYQKSLNAVLQPLKIVNYGLMADGNLEVPIYDKFAISTIFRQMGQFGHAKAERIELMDLLDRMEAKGKYFGLKTIDMVKMNTAVKSAGKIGFQFYKDEKLEEVADFSDIPVFEQPYALSRKQLVTDPHDQLRMKIGTQMIKMGMDNLRMADEIYDDPRNPGKKIKGSEIADHILRSTREISNKGRDRIIEKLGIQNGRVDKAKLTKFLKENNVKAGVADLITDAFKMDGKDMYLELDAFPNRRQLFAGIISSFSRESIDMKLPGNQFIQVSNLGIRLNKSDELKWTTVEKDGVNSMECYVSINLFKSIIPNYDKQSFAEKRKWVLANKDNVIGYRIPTQGQGSVWMLNVKDVYPETIGDVITLPTPFTSLTGSDFDVDKVFAVRHNYVQVKGRPQKVEFLNTPQEVWDKVYAPRYEGVYKALERLDKIKNNDFAPTGGKIATEDLLKDLSTALGIDLTDEGQKESSFNKMLANIYNDKFVDEEYENLKKQIGTAEENKKKYFDKYENETDPWKFNSREAVENLLMDSYRSVYSNKAHLRETTTPLGSGVGALKDLAKEIHSYDEVKAKSNDLSIFTPSKQSESKFEQTAAKYGMAPFALNNVHHILSQVAGLKMRDSSGGMLNEDAAGNIDLSQKNGKDNRDISSWLSALIDLHIDNPKDPCVTWLNLNPTTWDVAGLLVRGGFGIDTFKLLSQPILKEYSNLLMDSEADNKITRFDDAKSIVKHLQDTWGKKLGDAARAEFDDRSLTNGDEMMNNIEQQKELAADPRWISKQLAYLDMFQSISKLGKKLNGLVQASQLDTKRFGNTITSIIDFSDRIDELIKGNGFIGLEKMFGSQADGNLSFLGPYYDNFLKFTLDTMSDMTIYSTPIFKQLLSDISLYTNTKFGIDRKRATDTIADELMGAIYAKFFNDADYVGTDAKRLVENVFKGTDKLLSEIKADPKYKELVATNPLIKILSKTPVGDYAKGEVLPFDTFLTVPNKSLKDPFTSNDLLYGWRDLFKSDDPQIRKLARMLMYYSYATSGFRNRMFSFYNFIPPEVMKEFEGVDPRTGETKMFSFNQFIKDSRDMMSDPNNIEMFSHLVDDTIKANWSNSMIVPRVQSKNRANEIYDEESGDLLAFSTNRFQNIIGHNKAEQPIYTKYLTTWIKGKTYLGKFVGLVTEDVKGKEIPHPVYKVIPKNSFERSGIVVKEYLFEKSAIESNNAKSIPDGEEFRTFTTTKNLELNPAYQKFEPIEDLQIVDTNRVMPRNLLGGTVVEDKAPVLKEVNDMHFTKGSAGKGQEISSHSDNLAFALTNPTHISPRGFQWQRSWSKGQEQWREYLSPGIDYEGNHYSDVEHAYQNEKGLLLTDDDQIQLMLDLMVNKLQRYPKLVEGIDSKGGVDYILDSTHNPTNGKTFWESSGSNGFIKTLAQAYLIVKGREGENVDAELDKSVPVQLDLFGGTELLDKQSPISARPLIADEKKLEGDDEYPFQDTKDADGSIFQAENKEILDFIKKVDLTDWTEVTKDEWNRLHDKYLHCK